MQWTDILAGALLLLFGRRLFWLFVGCVGFIVGFDFASNLFQGQPQWLLLAIAIGVGLLGAIASVFIQRLVVGIAGFLPAAIFWPTSPRPCWPLPRIRKPFNGLLISSGESLAPY